MSGKKALLAGASGLVGNELIRLLLEAKDYDEVIAIVRTPLELSNPKLTQLLVNFDQLEEYKEQFAVNDVYCCLGTTIKKAGSKETMYKIDVEYPVKLAELSQQMGAKQFLIISSLGANPDSSIWYSKMKGILQQEISQIPFQSLSIFQPSLLLGNRKEFRIGEKAAEIVSKGLGFLFVGPFRRFKAIPAKNVALAMYRTAQLNLDGTRIYPSEKIASIANG